MVATARTADVKKLSREVLTGIRPGSYKPPIDAGADKRFGAERFFGASSGPHRRV
jgi:hypothetical protein